DRILGDKVPGRVFGPGDAVTSNGQTEPSLMLVWQGAVNIFRQFRGEKLFVKRLDDGAIFGEMRMFGQSMYGAQAEAAEWSEIVSLTIRDIEAIAKACPGFMLRLARELGPRLAEAQRRYEMAVFQQVPERLASVLLDLAGSDGEINDVSQQDLADRVGVYRETISLAIAELKRMGLILAARRKIKLIDVDGLRSFTSYGHV
ncbi:MAG TPA: Crp/Fnr family transcriptional regulator, partial [Blastocatellia bacterium]